ncbi:hypothetical protein C357_18075 [Citreicella sp. 357]|nr:hypothetical protein C357_18075 [Citreicella sp. 357]
MDARRDALRRDTHHPPVLAVPSTGRDAGGAVVQKPIGEPLLRHRAVGAQPGRGPACASTPITVRTLPPAGVPRRFAC